LNEIFKNTCIGLHVKYSRIKFLENSSSGSQVVPCGRTDRRIWWSY